MRKTALFLGLFLLHGAGSVSAPGLISSAKTSMLMCQRPIQRLHIGMK